MKNFEISRRVLIGSAGALLLPGYARATSIKLTPACADGDEPTPAQTAGPYYTPNSPKRRNLLEDGMEGERITLSGFVVDRNCRPVWNALLDLWHCDAAGVYDNAGYRLRGHQFSDVHGRYVFETIVPGLYPGRTRHFHVKVQAPGQSVLTTQLYFPEESANARDRIYDPALQLRNDFPLLPDMTIPNDNARKRYDFMLDIG